MFGESWEANAKHDNDYPLLYGAVRPSPIVGTSETFRLEFAICTKAGINRRGVTEALSDTKQICKDLISYFTNPYFDDDFQINKQSGVTLNPFQDADDDGVYGWSFELDIIAPFDWDVCQIPVTGLPVPSNTGLVEIYDINTNQTIVTLNAGARYGVEQLQAIIDTITNNTTTIIDPIV